MVVEVVFQTVNIRMVYVFGIGLNNDEKFCNFVAQNCTYEETYLFSLHLMFKYIFKNPGIEIITCLF